MTNTLYLFIDHALNLEQAYSLVVAAEGDIIEPRQQRVLAELLELQQKYQLTVILPCTLVTAHLITLPTTKKAKQIIPNMLEEELITDIEQLHFVLKSNPVQDNQYLVYTIEHTNLAKLLEKLHQLQLQPNCITSDLLFEAKPSIVVGDDYSQLLTSNHLGALSNSILPSLDWQQFNVLEYIQCADSNKNMVTMLQSQNMICAKQHSITYQEMVSQSLHQSSPLNLMQDQYTAAKKQNLAKTLLALPLLILSICVFIGANIFQYHHQKQQLKQVEKNNFQRYKAIFPEASTMISPRFRIEQRLKQQDNAKQSPFFELMAVMAPLFHQQKQLTVNSISYQNEQLTITFQLANFSELDSLQQKLSTKAITVHQISATTKKDLVNAVWRLSL